jgi:hypothetical protein
LAVAIMHSIALRARAGTACTDLEQMAGAATRLLLGGGDRRRQELARIECSGDGLGRVIVGTTRLGRHGSAGGVGMAYITPE